MGHLDEPAFERMIARCATCGGGDFEITSYLDRQVSVMLATANDDGRWVHDGEKFIDGAVRIRCTGCGTQVFASDDCPRCHRAGALPEALQQPSRLVVPKRCPSCASTELTLTAFAPATARTGATAGRVTPTPTALLGDDGFHVSTILCDGCDWVAAAKGCPMCGGPGPLRSRP
jgi:hypothetical protein